jgi:hypothetical protein
MPLAHSGDSEARRRVVPAKKRTTDRVSTVEADSGRANETGGTPGS